MLGSAGIWVGSTAEGVQIKRAATIQLVTEILPLTNIITQLAGHQTALQKAVQLHTHLITAGPGRAVQAALITEHHEGICGEIIHGCGHFRIDQGHITVRCGIGNAVFVFFQVPLQGGDQCFVEIPAPFLTGDHGTNILAKSIQSAGMQTGLCFTNGQDHHFFHILGAALGVGVKVTHGVQLITKEFCPEGPVSGGREYIQNTAAHRKLAGALHHGTAAVAGIGQPFQQGLKGVLTAGTQRKGGTGENVSGHGALAQSFPGKDL